MTIIVTGGAGFIGSNFIFHMLSAHPDYRIGTPRLVGRNHQRRVPELLRKDVWE